MKALLSELILFDSLKTDPVLRQIAEILSEAEYSAAEDAAHLSALRAQLFSEVHHILETATRYGFRDDLWGGYLTWRMMTDEHPLALVSEKREMPNGSAADLFEMDLEKIRALLHYDFSSLEEKLGTSVLSTLRHYHAVQKNERMYFRSLSEIVNSLRERLMQDSAALPQLMQAFYRDYGVGLLGLNKAFRIRELPDGTSELEPIHNLEQVHFEDLLGYESQKALIRGNVGAFLEGRAFNNMLLYGDAGTGKSTSVKAALHEFYPQGLRLIEIYKHQFRHLSQVISQVKSRNYHFLLFMDDLSFEEFEIEYKYLKAVIEGGFETRPDNIIIVATSNRRHLIKENLSDRKDMIDQEDLHHSDTVEEKLSLVDRFGLNILFSRPTHEEYLQIVRKLATRYDILLSDEELIRRANTWSVRKGGCTGRIAQQFINSLAPRLSL